MISSFAPNVNGQVWALASDGVSLWIGGTFTSVNGVARRGVAKLNPTTGAVDSAFNANLASGKVTELALVGGRLLAGGTFPGKLRALHPATGANTGYLNLAISGSVADNAGPVEVYRFAVNPAGTGWSRWATSPRWAASPAPRAFMLTLGATTSVNPWYYPPRQDLCRAGSLPDYMRDVIGAINPATGLAPAWNPTKERGVGGKDLYVTPAGLWVASDTSRIGGETHRRIALMPVP